MGATRRTWSSFLWTRGTRVLCLSSCLQSVVEEHCSLLFYRLGNNSQTDQGDETEGLEIDGLERKGMNKPNRRNM